MKNKQFEISYQSKSQLQPFHAFVLLEFGAVCQEHISLAICVFNAFRAIGFNSLNCSVGENGFFLARWKNALDSAIGESI
jgi:hypothetical protein